MGRREYSQRHTLYDLYVERDGLTWYFRFLATLGAWATLVGYIVFTFAATTSPKDLVTERSTLIVAGAVLLVVGHVLVASTYLIVQSWLFRLDVILIPTLISCSIGFLAILIHQALHQTLSFSSPLVYLPLLFATAGVIGSTSLALWTHRCIQGVRAADNRRREHRSQNSLGGAWQTLTSDDTSTIKLLPNPPSDELQRQQLEQLLSKRDFDRAPSPDAQSNTYRIDLPSGYSPTNQHLLTVPTNSGRVRSQSEGHQRPGWQLQNLRNLLPTRRQANTSASWKDPREVRREEIERGGYRTSILQTPRSAYGPSSPFGDLQDANASRYA